jgi:hypothetical protein
MRYRMTDNTEVMRQRIRDAPARTRLAHWSLPKSTTVVACCPRPARNRTKMEIASGHSPYLSSLCETRKSIIRTRPLAKAFSFPQALSQIPQLLGLLAQGALDNYTNVNSGGLP